MTACTGTQYETEVHTLPLCGYLPPCKKLIASPVAKGIRQQYAQQPSPAYSPAKSKKAGPIERTGLIIGLDTTERAGIGMVDQPETSSVLERGYLVTLGEPVNTAYGHWLFPPAAKGKSNTPAHQLSEWIRDEARNCLIRL